MHIWLRRSGQVEAFSFQSSLVDALALVLLRFIVILFGSVLRRSGASVAVVSTLSVASVAVGCIKLGMGYVAQPVCEHSRPEAIALLSLSIILPVTEAILYFAWFRDSKKAEVRRPLPVMQPPLHS